MWWLLIVLAVIGVAALIRRRNATLTSRSVPVSRPTRPAPGSPPDVRLPPRGSLFEAETLRLLGEMDAEAARMLPQIEAEVDRRAQQIEADAAANVASVDYPAPAEEHPARRPTPEPTLPAARGAHGGPSWMSDEDWQSRLVAYRKQGRSAAQIAEVAAHLERRGPRSRTRPVGAPVPRRRNGSVSGGGHEGMVVREDFVAKENEARHMVREDTGLPALRLVEAGDRLCVWSPADGGALINPKGPGLRRLGLYSSSTRGWDYHLAAYRSADLRKGRWVDLVREPDNAHDANAVMICPPGSAKPVGYVQRGRAPAVSRRMDTGEDMAGICLRGPGPGSDDGTAWLLIGSRADLAAMLGS